jgi:transcriptional regulator with GAF, ATPase, and Fis domain
VPRKEEWSRRYGAIIGRSRKLMRVFHILDRVAQSEGTVLIVGESGTGKELVAEAIHRNSPRSSGPFVKLNCAALVESLLLSELFGHERGSFTGAHQRKIGRFEMAAGGTLFLDEIGDISPKTQVALLRVLQEREFERVGGGQTLQLDARIVFATNRNLAQMVKEGTFREDLYYRLKGITIDVPPLRDRREDIVDLAGHFLSEFSRESGAPEKYLTDDAINLLVSYAWPGNIRELENIIRSVALFAENDAVSARDFDEYRELFGDALTQLVSREQGTARTATDGSAAPAATRGLAAVAGERELPATSRRGPAGGRPEDLPPRGEGGPHARGSEEAARAPVPGADRLTERAHADTSPDAAWTPQPTSGIAEGEATSRPSGAAAAPDEAPDLLGRIFDEGIPLPDLKKQIQAEAIARALRMTDGNITRAAEVLGMRRPRLSQIINADDMLKQLAQGASR